MPVDAPARPWPVMLSIERLAEYLDMSESSILRAVAKGKFPRPVTPVPGMRLARWRRSDVDAWLNDLEER